MKNAAWLFTDRETIARHETNTVLVTLVQRDENFIVEAVDLTAQPWDDMIWAFEVLDNRLAAWEEFDWQVKQFGNK